jgi:hypothetical protein
MTTSAKAALTVTANLAGVFISGDDTPNSRAHSSLNVNRGKKYHVRRKKNIKKP